MVHYTMIQIYGWITLRLACQRVGLTRIDARLSPLSCQWIVSELQCTPERLRSHDNGSGMSFQICARLQLAALRLVA